jgi:hypothetical protein
MAGLCEFVRTWLDARRDLVTIPRVAADPQFAGGECDLAPAETASVRPVRGRGCRRRAVQARRDRRSGQVLLRFAGPPPVTTAIGSSQGTQPR